MATANKTITPPSTFASAGPEIGVEIYPHSGGSYTLSGSNYGVISAEVGKDIRDRNGGRFVINLAPGGPKGVDDPNSWLNIITPNSLAIIYLSRAGSRRIVMVGVVVQLEESQVWNNSRVIRTIKLTGVDFGYYFNAFSYYELSYLGLIQSQFPTGPAGYILGQFGKQLDGAPAELAYLWLKDVMLGQGNAQAQGVLEDTYLMYKGTKYYLRQLFGFLFEAFTEANSTVFIPYLTDVVNSEGSWFDKFVAILPWPYYEFFVTTGNASDYPALSGASTVPVPTTGINSSATTNFNATPSFTITVDGYNSVYPIVIGRINPLPWITYTSTGAAGSLYRDRWDALPSFSLGSFSFIESNVIYSVQEVANFFGVNTVDSSCIANASGSSNANLFAFEIIGGIIDRTSINTYGFRPNWVNTRWLTSLSPIVSNTQFNSGSIPFLSSVLLGKLASYYIPTPNMLHGQVVFPMWPDVFPGCKFTYKPFKDSTDAYEFYVEGVTHYYTFGGKSGTILDISRGLRVTDYNDNDIITGIHLDTYARIDNKFVPRLDVSTIAGAYYISPSTIASVNASLLNSPYNSAPPTIK